MKERIVLVFDVGTQSSRALLINNSGEILGKSQIKHDPAYVSVNPNWAERDADAYYDNICACSRDLKQRFPEIFARVEAASITTIRDTPVCVDKEGKPLRPAIIWLDMRTAEGGPKLPGHISMLFKTLGLENLVDTQFQRSYCNWIMQNEPEIWEKTDKYLLLSSYLIYRLTGEMSDSDAGLVGHIPFDYKERTWQKKGALTRPVFDVEESKLCKVVKATHELGRITAAASRDTGLPEGLSLIASGSDKACEILGMGCLTKEKAVIGLGTTANITFTSNKYLEIEKYVPPYDSIMDGYFTPEFQIFRGYWLISWFKREFAEKEAAQAETEGVSAEEILNRSLRDIPAGCDGLLFQPYFTPNVTMPAAKGALVGFTDLHTRMHVYRAIIEGINFALMQGFKLMEQKAGHKFEEISLGGGGSQSAEICQITADMFGIPAKRMQTYEASGIGAAISAFVGIGEFKDFSEAVGAMVRTKDVFTPDMANHETYSKLYENVYKKIYPAVSGLYEDLNKIIR